MSTPKVEVITPGFSGTGVSTIDKILPFLHPVATGSIVTLFRAIADYRKEQQLLANDLEKIVKKYQIFRESMQDQLTRERMSRDVVLMSLKYATKLSIKFKNPDIFKEALSELRDFNRNRPNFTEAAIEAMKNMDD